MPAARSCCVSMTSPVYVVDELVARPGQGKRLLDEYLAHYAPGATARGMALEQVLVSPPVWMDDQPNTLTIIWTVAGAEGWWAMRLGASADPGVAAFWDGAGERLLSRRRSFAAAPEAVEALCRD
jgi:hypothetical protein